MDSNELIKKVQKAEKDDFTFKIKPKYSNYLTYRLIPKDLLFEMHTHFQETQTLGLVIEEIGLGVF
jgi:hypothetical protein